MSSLTRIWGKPMLAGSGVLLGLLALLLCLWGLGGDPGREEVVSIGEGEDAGISQASAEDSLVEDPMGPIRTSDREQLLVESDRRGDEAGGEAEAKAVLTGRCVAAEDGRPLANCEIYLSGLAVRAQMYGDWEGSSVFEYITSSEWDNNWMGLAGKEKRERLWIRPIHLDRFFLSQTALDELRKEGRFYQRKPNAKTDAEGRFRVEFWPGGEIYIMWSLFTSSPMRLPRQAAGLWFKPGETRDLGVLRLHAGLRVSGRVVNERGEGLVGARVQIKGLPSRLPDARPGAFPSLVMTFCKKDGWFAFYQPIPNGRWRLTVKGQGVASFSQWILVQGKPLDLTLRVKERPTISGIVRDISGKPSAGEDLLAVSADRVVQGSGSSDAEGHFVIRATGASLPPVRLVSKSSYRELLDAPRATGWGSQAIQLRVRSTPPLDLLLLDSETGKPVSGLFNISARPAWAAEDEHVAGLVEPKDGLLQIENIRSGPHHLQINLNGTNHWVRRGVHIDIPIEGPRRIEVKMQAAVPFRVLVVDGRGNPVAGAKVGISRTAPPGEPIPWWYNSPDFLADAWTDAKGIATPIGVAEGVTVDIQASHDGFVTGLRRAVRITRQGPVIRVIIGSGGSLRGTVLPGGGKGADWTLHLIEKNSKTIEILEVAEDGSFGRNQIRAGHYLIYLQAGAAEGRQVGEVIVREGRIQELQIRSQPVPLAEISLRLQGLPRSVGSWTPYLSCDAHKPSFDQKWARRIGPGDTLQRRLPAGVYQLLLLPDSGQGSTTPYYHSSQAIELKAGQKLRTTIHVEPAQTRLEILNRDGSPATHQSFELQYRHPGSKSWTSHQSLRTDAKGSVLLQQLTPWPMRLVLPGTSHSTTPITWTGQKALRLHLKAR